MLLVWGGLFYCWGHPPLRGALFLNKTQQDPGTPIRFSYQGCWKIPPGFETNRFQQLCGLGNWIDWAIMPDAKILNRYIRFIELERHGWTRTTPPRSEGEICAWSCSLLIVCCCRQNHRVRCELDDSQDPDIVMNRFWCEKRYAKTGRARCGTSAKDFLRAEFSVDAHN